jgi:hypothetical protein
VLNGVITTVAGNGTRGFSGDNGPATNDGLTGPLGLAVDSAGSLYFVDGNRRIRKYQFHVRGLAKVGMEALWEALTYNTVSLLRYRRQAARV